MLDVLLGWPLIIYVLGISIVSTVALGFVQFRYFFYAWKYLLIPSKDATTGEMSPIQAFINTLSANLGNGSLAGMATALYSGGPGAAFWVLMIGFIMMSVRFAEVYLSTYFAKTAPAGTTLGGPMLYLRQLPFGSFVAYIYGIFCLLFSFIIGNAMQANSIRLSIATTWDVQPIFIALIILAFVMYVVSGGAARVIQVSDKIVPVKVIVFFVSSTLVLIYHSGELLDALRLIITSAFTPLAIAGGTIGFTVQQAMRFGVSRSILATEAGLGTAAVLFGFTGSKKPMDDAIMSMMSVFISTFVCFMVSLCIVASGVWDNGLTSTALTIASYNTLFGQYGGWIVSFLSVSFGIGVLVTYVYIARAAWLFLTGGRLEFVFSILYCLCAFAGALVNVDVVWKSGDVVNAVMLLINLLGIAYLLPVMRKGISEFQQKG